MPQACVTMAGLVFGVTLAALYHHMHMRELARVIGATQVLIGGMTCTTTSCVAPAVTCGTCLKQQASGSAHKMLAPMRTTRVKRACRSSRRCGARHVL
jgi:hypothetical protein